MSNCIRFHVRHLKVYIKLISSILSITVDIFICCKDDCIQYLITGIRPHISSKGKWLVNLKYPDLYRLLMCWQGSNSDNQAVSGRVAGVTKYDEIGDDDPDRVIGVTGVRGHDDTGEMRARSLMGDQWSWPGPLHCTTLAPVLCLTSVTLSVSQYWDLILTQWYSTVVDMCSEKLTFLIDTELVS